MAQATLTIAIVLAVLAVVLIGIATAINGFVSLKYPSGSSERSKLLAASALTGFTAIFAIVTAIVGILYARARTSAAKNTKALGITFLVLAIVTGLMFITVIALDLSLRSSTTVNTSDKASMIASVLLASGGLISLVVATILFFTLTKGKSGKEALSNLRYQRTPKGSSSMGSSSMSSTAVSRSGTMSP